MKTTNHNRSQRAAIAAETLLILEQGYYLNMHGKRVPIKEELDYAVQASRHYTATALSELNILGKQGKGEEKFDTRISVSNETCLSAARQLIMQGENKILCLNFASEKNPGGGFLSGSEAQEENLAKSSGLYPCLTQMMAMYESNRHLHSSIYLDDMIYSPEVPVFRDDDYALLEQPYLVSFISSPAVNTGAVKINEAQRLHEVPAIMQNRVNYVLALAQRHGHQNLVLGAWGCGVFGNDPKDVAHYFALAISPGADFYGVFKNISFAVLDKNNNGSYVAFATEFKNNKE